MAEKRFITVILPIRLEWEPFYSITDQQVGIGSRARVQFTSKTYSAIVSAIDVIPTTSPEKIKPVISVENDLEPVSEKMILLWRQISEYYMCTIGEVYKAAFPAHKIAAEEIMARIKSRRQERLAKVQQAFDNKLATLCSRLSKKQDLLPKSKQVQVKQRYEEQIEIIKQQIETVKAQQETLAKSLVRKDEVDNAIVFPESITLSPSQTTAKEEIGHAFAHKKVVLLNGVTGSGKTEIYMSLAIKTLNEGKNVLYLVPEISLSRQLEDRLSSVFNENLLTFHSRESITRRQEIADIVGKGHYMVLGTRSALFLPHHDLGLIIVDEEHDTSYKQEDPAPRYNGRDAAIMLGVIMKANVILGSATPSAESLFNCTSGRFVEVKLKDRYYLSGDAEIEVIDTIAERHKNGMIGDFSRKLISHINDALNLGEQVMILRARRAYSLIVQCDSCGGIIKCPHCNVPLSLHKDNFGNDTLVCRYCGHRESLYGKCEKCGGELKPFGAGTQKIEEEAKSIFPDASIARLDSDTAKGKNFEQETIHSFAKGEIDILIGTQIVTKGFDFSGLTLVAVLQADSLIGLQDFRADERALQLLAQFRGRCGRRDKPGLFVIQTNQPDHPVYKCLTDSGDLVSQSSFNSEMLSDRRQFQYPPFSRQIDVVFKDANLARLEKLSYIFGSDLHHKFPQVLGPYSPVVDKIADQYIKRITVTFLKDKYLSSNKTALGTLISDFGKDKSYADHILVDVDPV